MTKAPINDPSAIGTSTGMARRKPETPSRGGGVFSVAGGGEGGRVTEPWLCGEGRLVFSGHMP
jgi:hypothetical protein